MCRHGSRYCRQPYDSSAKSQYISSYRFNRFAFNQGHQKEIQKNHLSQNRLGVRDWTRTVSPVFQIENSTYYPNHWRTMSRVAF